MQIPGCENAVVDVRKLRDYCLSTSHLRGRHKARVFASVLGLTDEHADELRNVLLDVVCNDDAVVTSSDEYGQRYALDFVMRRDDKEATIRSVWIIRYGEDFPRLTTCYVL